MNKYIEEYLSILKVERNLAYNSLDSYRRDLKKYRHFVKETLNISSISDVSLGHKDHIFDILTTMVFLRTQ